MPSNRELNNILGNVSNRENKDSAVADRTQRDICSRQVDPGVVEPQCFLVAGWLERVSLNSSSFVAALGIVAERRRRRGFARTMPFLGRATCEG